MNPRVHTGVAMGPLVGNQVPNMFLRVGLLCLPLVMTMSCSTWLFAQTNGDRSIGGLSTNLPTIPPTSPRRIESDGETIDTAAPVQPIASFVDSIKGNDAAFSVVVGQGRLLTLKERIANPNAASVIAVGDPSIAEFQLLPNPKLVRILGLRPGVTDLSITTATDETVSLQVHVIYDLELLEARLRQLFPSALLKLGQLRDHLVVEGQARNTAQAERIIETLEAYLSSLQAETEQQAQTGTAPPPVAGDAEADQVPAPSNLVLGGIGSARARAPQASVINLLRIPGVQQVLLQVRIAELNRTAMREVGADILGVDPDTGNLAGTQIGGAAVSASGLAGLGGLLSSGQGDLGTSSTAFGIFPSGDWQVIMRLLRQNGVARVLAEPNLIAMSGHRANFLAGGEFPVPIPQASGAGTANSVTVDFREFGVRLDFLPYVVDEDRIRLSVTPEVSTIDFSLGTTLVVGGDPVPGLNTRRANTTVEMKPGQTLAMAGLLQVELGGQTSRIPGLGDLPYLGPFFSNTTHRRVEKELLVLVTPQLVEPIDGCEALPLPGDELEDPTDKELYLKNRYEGHTGVRHRSTIQYWHHPRKLRLYEKRMLSGAIGFGP